MEMRAIKPGHNRHTMVITGLRGELTLDQHVRYIDKPGQQFRYSFSRLGMIREE
jgi:hypothetical protein